MKESEYLFKPLGFEMGSSGLLRRAVSVAGVCVHRTPQREDFSVLEACDLLNLWRPVCIFPGNLRVPAGVKRTVGQDWRPTVFPCPWCEAQVLIAPPFPCVCVLTMLTYLVGVSGHLLPFPVAFPLNPVCAPLMPCPSRLSLQQQQHEH